MLLQDIRYSLRTLARAPGFAMVAILSLALGIGANTAIFTLVDTVLLRSLPVKSPNRLVLLAEARRSGPHFNFSYPTYKDFRDRNEVFSGVLACFPISLSLSVADQAERISGELVSGNYFEVLGVGALAGRIFGPSEDQTPGGHPVAVLSYGFWQRRFGADPAIVGQTIRLNGLPFTVIGITPARFASTELGFSPDIRAPMMMQPQLMTGQDLLHTRTTNWLSTVARLKPGVTPARAQAAMDTLYRQVRQAEVQAFGDIPPVRRQQLLEDRLLVLPGSQGVSEVRRELSTPLLVLMAVVGTVLLIACANVANLLLARGAARRKEIAVRLALGAGRLRLVRQLLAESTLLACAGGAAGLLFALWGEWGLLALLAQSGNPISLDVHTDARILAFTAVVSLLTGVLFGLAPALQATRTPVGPVLQDLPEASGPLRFGPRRALIAGQIALSVVLLAGAGLFVHTLRNLQSVSLGFERDHLLLLSLDPGLNGYSPQEGRAFFDRLLERVRALPGVGEAGLAQIGPLTGGGIRASYSVQGYQPRPGEDMQLNRNTVTPGYFATMGIPVVLGRGFRPQDNEAAPKVAIINEQAARYFFKDASPIGRRLNVRPADPAGIEIVGVVRNAKYRSLREATWRTVYLPFAQAPAPGMTLHVRTASDPEKMVAAVRREVQTLDRNLPVFDVRTMKQQIDSSLFRERMVATLSTFFSALALLLAAVGLYGVISYAVTRRTREIGIRMALGARGGDILAWVLKDMVLLLVIGLAAGIPLALVLPRLASALLYGVAPGDPGTILGAAAVMAVVALIASYLPARRATQLDPMRALRHQ